LVLVARDGVTSLLSEKSQRLIKWKKVNSPEGLLVLGLGGRGSRVGLALEHVGALLEESLCEVSATKLSKLNKTLTLRVGLQGSSCLVTERLTAHV
jgi:hypothetical protein